MKINESVDNNHIQKVVTIMKPPYLEDLRMFNIPTEKWEEVFSLLFNRDINSIELDRNINRDATILYVDIPTSPPKLPLYVEWDNGPWLLRDYDDNGNMIYYEESDGYWEKYEFDNDSNPTYYENSEGYSDDYSENSLNESVGDKENMVIDKIINFMLEDTKYKIKTIKGEPTIKIIYPFYSDQIVIMKWWDLNYALNHLGDDPLDAIHLNYINNQYGITDTSLITEIFNKYTLILFTELKKELESKMENDSLNESVESNDRRKNYLDKVLEYILSDTQIEPHPMWPSDWVNISVPFTSLVYSRIIHFDREDFFTYCRDTYGLTKFETYGMWEDYVDEVNQILRKDWGITDPVYH